MPGQTPNFGIRYPLGSERADIRDIETMARDIDTSLEAIKAEAQQEINSKITPTKLAWTPTVTGITIGNAAVTYNAWQWGDMIEVEVVIVHATSNPTTHLIVGQNPTFTLPYPAANFPYAGGGFFRPNSGAWPVIYAQVAGAFFLLTSHTSPLGTALGATTWTTANFLLGYAFYRAVVPA